MKTFTQRTRRYVAVGVLAMLTVAACGDDSSGSTTQPTGSDPGTTKTEPVVGGTAEFLIHADIASLDPAKSNATAAAGGTHLYAVYGALVVQAPGEAEMIPVLAESLEPDADFDTWTLALRDDLVFSDGSPFDAEAVKVNWLRVKDPATASPGLSAAAEISQMTVVDDTTLKLDLVAPNALFDRVVGRSNLNYIAAPSAFAAGHDPSNDPIGAGPFTLESWVRDSEKVFVRNPNWYDAPRPYLDRLTLRVVADEQQRLDTMLTGGANGLYTNASNTIADGTDAGAEFTGLSVGSGSVVNLNVTAAPFDDLRMRKVVAMGVDYGALIEAVEGASGEAPTNMAPDDAPWHSSASALPGYDKAGAQRLLDEYLRETGQQSVTVRMITVTAPRTTAIAKFVQTSLAQLDGIEVTVEPLDQASLIERAFSRSYELANWGYPTVNPDPDIHGAVYGGARTNTTGYANDRVDELFDEARRTASPDARIDLYREVFTILAKDLPFRPINHSRNGWVHDTSTKVDGVHLDGILRSDQVWLVS